MARRRSGSNTLLVMLAPVAIRLFRRLPLYGRVLLIVAVVVAAGAYWYIERQPPPPVAPDADPTTGLNPDGSGTFQFAFWNVENLFDDVDDNRRSVDETYDDPFARDVALRNEKYDHIASAIVTWNGGRGPDILACAEVESRRAAELLRLAINAKLSNPKWHYTAVSMVELDGGRHIATCVLTRLPVDPAFTIQHGYQIRILESRLRVNGHDLTILSSHWTSQLRQRDGGNGESGRENYARTLREVYDKRMREDPSADVIFCGDFNATPDSPEVGELLQLNRPRPLIDLLSNKSAAQYGTINYNGNPLIYDQICISPNLTDGRGWECDVASVETVTSGLMRAGSTRREPWRFGNPGSPPSGGRGYSDHFPVLVTLTVKPRDGDLPRGRVAP